jgi:hypothetical protein
VLRKLAHSERCRAPYTPRNSIPASVTCAVLHKTMALVRGVPVARLLAGCFFFVGGGGVIFFILCAWFVLRQPSCVTKWMNSDAVYAERIKRRFGLTPACFIVWWRRCCQLSAGQVRTYKDVVLSVRCVSAYVTTLFFSLSPITAQSAQKGNKHIVRMWQKGERNQRVERSIPVNIVYRKNILLQWVQWTNNRELWQSNEVWGWSRWTWLWVQMV